MVLLLPRVLPIFPLLLLQSIQTAVQSLEFWVNSMLCLVSCKLPLPSKKLEKTSVQDMPVAIICLGLHQHGQLSLLKNGWLKQKLRGRFDFMAPLQKKVAQEKSTWFEQAFLKTLMLCFTGIPAVLMEPMLSLPIQTNQQNLNFLEFLLMLLDLLKEPLPKHRPSSSLPVLLLRPQDLRQDPAFRENLRQHLG